MKKDIKAKNGQVGTKRVGRPRLLDDGDCFDLATKQRGKDLAKDSATSGQLQTIIYEKRKEKAKKDNKNVLGVKSLVSKPTLAKYKQLIVPVKVKSAMFKTNADCKLVLIYQTFSLRQEFLCRCYR